MSAIVAIVFVADYQHQHHRNRPLRTDAAGSADVPTGRSPAEAAASWCRTHDRLPADWGGGKC
jgi:hypothetical protein